MNDDTDNTDPTADLVDALQYSDGETAGQKLHEFLNTRDVAKVAIERRHREHAKSMANLKKFQDENPDWSETRRFVLAFVRRRCASRLRILQRPALLTSPSFQRLDRTMQLISRTCI
jgi:hypothetical protein